MPQSADVKIAAGSTTPEAQAALGSMGHAAEKRLLQAYLTQSFDQLERDAAGLDTRNNNSFFTQHVEGYLWDITNTDSTTPPPDETELETEREWLQQLNADQTTYDTAERMVAGLRQRLYDLWHVSQIPNSGYDQDTYNQKINAIADALNTQLTTMANLIAGGLPNGDTEAALAQSISAYEQKKNLPSSRALTRLARKGFYSPNDPVLLFGGLDAPDPFEAPSPLPCRTLSQTITTMKVGGTTHTPFHWGRISRPQLVRQPARPGQKRRPAPDPGVRAAGLRGGHRPIGGRQRPDPSHERLGPGRHQLLLLRVLPGDLHPVLAAALDPLLPAVADQLLLPAAGRSGQHRLPVAVRPGRQVLRPHQTGQPLPGHRPLSGYARLSPTPQSVANAAAEQHARLYPDAPSQNLESFNLSREACRGLRDHRSSRLRCSQRGRTRRSCRPPARSRSGPGARPGGTA